MNQELKQSIDFTFELCEEVERKLQNYVTLQKPLRILLQAELMVYIMYLSDSDATIDVRESGFLLDYLGYDYSPKEIDAFLKNQKVELFPQTIPYCFQLFVKADNIMYLNSGNISLASYALYEIYEALGLELIAVDQNIDVQEYRDLTNYLNMLEAYMNRNLEAIKKRSVH